MKKVLSFILVCIFTIGFMVTFSACGNTDDEKGQEGEQPSVPAISYDATTDFGLYWYGGATEEDYIRSSQNVSETYFDPNKPTVITFHGWNYAGENKKDYAKLMLSPAATNKAHIPNVNIADKLREQGYNVGQFNWCKYASSLGDLFERIWIDFNQEHSLAYLFACEYGVFFENYTKEISFIGHSYGAQAAIATAYLANVMVEKNIIKNSACIPQRITLADPYIGDFAVQGNEKVKNAVIDYLDEEVNGRWPAQIFADKLEVLNKKGVVVDIYCGMPLAYDGFVLDNKELRAEVYKQIKSNCVWTVLKGMNEAYGTLGDIHTLTYDWTLLSLFKVINKDGVYFPTAGLDNDNMRKLVGLEYESLYKGINLERESLIQVNKG